MKQLQYRMNVQDLTPTVPLLVPLTVPVGMYVVHESVTIEAAAPDISQTTAQDLYVDAHGLGGGSVRLPEYAGVSGLPGGSLGIIGLFQVKEVDVFLSITLAGAWVGTATLVYTLSYGEIQVK